MTTSETYSPVVCAALFVAANFAAAEEVGNAIFPKGARLQLLHSRQVKLNSGLTEGPAVAPDGSGDFTDRPLGQDSGMILRLDPNTRRTAAFTDKALKSNRPGLHADGQR